MAPEQIAERVEEVLVKNLGQVGKFLFKQQLDLLGKDRSSFTEDDLETLVKGILADFEKVIGTGVYELEKELYSCVKEDS